MTSKASVGESCDRGVLDGTNVCSWPTADEIAAAMRGDRPSHVVRYVARFGACEIVWALDAVGRPVGSARSEAAQSVIGRVA